MANEVRILVKAKDEASKTLKQIDTNAKGTERSFLGLNRSAIGLGLGIAGVGAAAGVAGAAMWNMANLASNLEESQNKVNEVFGSSAHIITDFAETASDNLRQTEQQALATAGTFGNMFVSFGTGEAVAADMSKTLVQLSADLASFNNIAASDAADKLRAGLAGSSEVLLPLGVDIRATTVEAHALARGFADTKSELTELDRVMARYELILQDTETAQGDAARTAGTFAERSATLQAKVEELQTDMGELVIGPMTQLVDLMVVGTDAANEFALALSKVGSVSFEGIGGGRTSIADLFGDAAASALPFGGGLPLIAQGRDAFGGGGGGGGNPITQAFGFGANSAAFAGASGGIAQEAMDTRSAIEQAVDAWNDFNNTAEGAAARQEQLNLTLELLWERARKAEEGLGVGGGLSTALDEIAEAAEEAARAAEKAAEAEQKLNEERNRGILTAQQQLIQAFLSNPQAGANLIPIINDPFGGGLPDVTRGPLTPTEIRLMVQIGDMEFIDAIASANRNLAAMGQ